MTFEISNNKKNKAFTNTAKPYKWVTIDGKKKRVEIVDVAPQGYEYLSDYNDYVLFVLKTMFANDDKYVLVPKKTCKNNTLNSSSKD